MDFIRSQSFFYFSTRWQHNHNKYLFIHTEKTMATHSSTLAWKIPWTEEPGRLQSMGSRRVGHGWATSLPCIGEGNGNPLQCSCLENSRDGGAWWAAVYGVAQSRTWLKWLSSSSKSAVRTSYITKYSALYLAQSLKWGPEKALFAPAPIIFLWNLRCLSPGWLSVGTSRIPVEIKHGGDEWLWPPKCQGRAVCKFKGF